MKATRKKKSGCKGCGKGKSTTTKYKTLYHVYFTMYGLTVNSHVETYETESKAIARRNTEQSINPHRKYYIKQEKIKVQ